MYEVFEHTADLGLRIRAADLESLFVEAARGLFSVLVTNLDEVRPIEERIYEIPGSQTDFLLFDWLTELLFAFETEHLLCSQFEVRLSPAGLSAVCRGEQLDPERHHMEHEV